MVTSKTVDFTSVKDGGGAFNKHRVPEGDYLATITKVEDAPAKSDDVFQYLFTIKLKKFGSYAYPYYCKLQENQLWKLRNLAIAAGLNVPKKRIKFDPTKVLNKVIGVTMEDDEYEGKLQSNIAALFPAAELMDGNIVDDDEDVEGDEDVEDEDVEDEEEVEEDTTDEYEGMDRTELKAALKARDASFVAKKSQTDDDLRDLLRESGDDEEEEEEEEPEPTPPPRRKVAAKPAAKPAARRKAPAKDVSDEELEELDIDDI